MLNDVFSDEEIKTEEKADTDGDFTTTVKEEKVQESQSPQDSLTKNQNDLNQEACKLFGSSLSELSSQDAQHACDNLKDSTSIVVL